MANIIVSVKAKNKENSLLAYGLAEKMLIQSGHITEMHKISEVEARLETDFTDGDAARKHVAALAKMSRYDLTNLRVMVI